MSMIIPLFPLTLVFRPHHQRIISMVCRRITSWDRHPRRAQFGRPGPNRSDRSHRPVRLVLWRVDRSDWSLRPVRPVPWCSILHHSHKSRLLLLWLIIAWSENWRILCRRIRRSHTVNPLFLHRCPRMFGMIGLGPIHSMPHKRCPLPILRHIISAKHLRVTMRPILLG